MAAIAVVLTSVCFIYELAHPSCHLCDDENYRIFAQRLVDGGAISERMLSIRTYGYPVLLTPFIFLGHSNSLLTAVLIAAAQLGTYLLSAWILYRVVCHRYSIHAGRLILTGLLCNYLAFPYLGLSLTDAPSLTIALLALSAMLVLLSESEKDTPVRCASMSAGLGFLIGFGIMVRPGNIHWIPALLAVLIFIIVRSRQKSSALFLPVLAGFILAITPQFILNAIHFHRYTFLPIYDLSALQFDAGVRYLKYTSYLTGTHPDMPYLNPWYTGTGSATLRWYFQHPLNGVKTIFFHFFGALDFDQLFPYVYNLNPWYRPLLFIYSHTVIYWGVIGYVLIARRACSKGFQSHETIAATLITVYAGSWCAVYALTAVENRFAIPVITILVPLALFALTHEFEKHNKALGLALFAVYLFSAGYLSYRLSLVRMT
ncbi:hypothetical protein ASG35_27275 [Burkholderia sp. Leaf177]|nr:hypothetical protein ASG35_27275 [Burkholderia sp. Leaf177]